MKSKSNNPFYLSSQASQEKKENICGDITKRGIQRCKSLCALFNNISQEKEANTKAKKVHKSKSFDKKKYDFFSDQFHINQLMKHLRKKKNHLNIPGTVGISSVGRAETSQTGARKKRTERPKTKHQKTIFLNHIKNAQTYQFTSVENVNCYE